MRAEKEEGGVWALGRKRVMTETRRRPTVSVPELLTHGHSLLGFSEASGWLPKNRILNK